MCCSFSFSVHEEEGLDLELIGLRKDVDFSPNYEDPAGVFIAFGPNTVVDQTASVLADICPLEHDPSFCPDESSLGAHMLLEEDQTHNKLSTAD